MPRLPGFSDPTRRVLPSELVLVALGATVVTPASSVLLVPAAAVVVVLADGWGHRQGRRSRTALAGTGLLPAARDRTGVATVLRARLIPGARPWPAVVAGASGLPLRRFLPPAALGALVFAAFWVGVGTLLRPTVLAPLPAAGPLGRSVLLVATAAALVALVVVRATTGPTPPRPDVSGRRLAGSLAVLGRGLVADGAWATVPNALTGVRLLLLPVIVVLMARQQYLPALVLIGVGFATDAADGLVARRTGTVSALGTWLDPLADRVAVVVVVGSFVLGGLLPWPAFVLLLLPDLLLAGASWWLFGGSPALPVTHVGKVRTAAVGVALVLLLVGVIAGPAGPVLSGVGAVLFLLGLAGHWVAAAQYATAMLRVQQYRRRPG